MSSASIRKVLLTALVGLLATLSGPELSAQIICVSGKSVTVGIIEIACASGGDITACDGAEEGCWDLYCGGTPAGTVCE